jgi:hypothetical protein
MRICRFNTFPQFSRKSGLHPRETLCLENLRFLTALVMRSSIFWNIESCSPLEVNCYLPPKRRLTFSGLHSVIFRKMELLILLVIYLTTLLIAQIIQHTLVRCVRKDVKGKCRDLFQCLLLSSIRVAPTWSIGHP